MKIISSFIQEQKRYSKKYLKKIFEFEEQGVEQFIKSLKSYNVLKAVKNSTEQEKLTDLVAEDIEVADETVTGDEYLYTFTYVGIITIGRRIIKIYPKYLLSAQEPIKEMKQVIKVLERYSKHKEQIINLYNGDGEDRSFNLIAVILFLLNDYHEYGVYNNSEDIVELNGEGAIVWGKTIDESFALIQNNSPYYMEIYTNRTVDNDMDYFKRLHECVLTECFKQLKESQLDELFDMTSVELSDESVDDFGGKDYILGRIQAELNTQFNTRRQILLKTLYAYIAQDRRMLEEDKGFSMYGTTAFNIVWEKVCANVFNNNLEAEIGNLKLKKPLIEGFDKTEKLKNIIGKPEWVYGEVKKESGDTLEPDLITIYNHNGEDWFIIFDAKYYNIKLEKDEKLSGNPGVGDVTKQYLYQLAYSDFIEKNFIKNVRNCFLMPTEENKIINKGYVKLEMLEQLGLENIQIRLLPAHQIFEYYITRKKWDIKKLEL